MIRVTDGAATSAQQVFSITVTAPPLIFSTYSLPDAKENAAYMAAMSVSGGTAPYNWSIVSGSLPSGLTIDTTTGTISGIPARGTTGTSSFSIRLTDSSATPVATQRNFTINVEKGSYQSTISIGTGLKAAETSLFINGIQVTSLQGGQSITRSFDLDTNQTISVEPLIQNPSEADIRYKAEYETITVTESSPDAQFNYYPEYYVEIKSQPADAGQFAGSGWYREGTVLQASAPGTIQSGSDPGTQYRFSSWNLPTGAQVTGGNLNQGINAPGVYTADYDTYYKLTFTSPLGEQKESAWYKAGTRAEWNLSVTQVPMSGILGFFKGTFNAANSRGSVVMDKPEDITITWEADYTLPLILIPAALLLAIICIYGLYALSRSPANKPVPFYPAAQASPLPFQPVSPQYYTAPPVYFTPPPVQFVPPPTRPVLPPPQPVPSPIIIPVLRPESYATEISEAEKPDKPSTARDKIMEDFGKLLDNYARDVVTARQNLAATKLTKADEVTKITITDPFKLN